MNTFSSPAATTPTSCVRAPAWTATGVFRVWCPITTVSGPFQPDTPSGSST